MKDTNTLEASGTGSREKSASNGRFDAAGVQLSVKRNGVALLGAVEAALLSATGETGETELRTRFAAALRLHNGATEGLAAVVSEAIEAGFDREDCIQWGIEDTELTEGYVRSTVSRLFVDLVGRERKAGGGRKANKGAEGCAARILKECDGSYAKAMALLLAARRLLEKASKA